MTRNPQLPDPIRGITPGTAFLSDMRTNDGGHCLMLKTGDAPDDDRTRIAVVDFQGTAKRGQAWCADDPEGRANAERLALCWNAHDGLMAVARAAKSFAELELELREASMHEDADDGYISSARELIAKIDSTLSLVGVVE